jgi:hypothetical protein
MAWVYLDDKFPRHPKVMAAMSIDPLAPWLFVCGLAYCREHLNGGLMHFLVIPTLMPLYKPRMRSALLTAGLWDDSGNDWVQVHDYEVWNQSEDDQRQARSDKASRAATARWQRTRLAKITAGSTS